MKLSQSNFNLRSPDCYLVRSYLIATVLAKKCKYKQSTNFVSKVGTLYLTSRIVMEASLGNAYPRLSTTILYLIQILRSLFIFPPSYVVTKLTYSHRSFMSKYS